MKKLKCYSLHSFLMEMVLFMNGNSKILPKKLFKFVYTIFQVLWVQLCYGFPSYVYAYTFVSIQRWKNYEIHQLKIYWLWLVRCALHNWLLHWPLPLTNLPQFARLWPLVYIIFIWYLPFGLLFYILITVACVSKEVYYIK